MKIFLIYPTQLFKYNKYLSSVDNIYIIEEPYYFTRYKFHKQKLVFHRATMRYYYELLQKKYKNIKYYNFYDITDYNKIFNKTDEIFLYNPIDKEIIDKLKDYNHTIYDTPLFLETDKELEDYRNTYTNGKNYYHDNSYYKWIRRKLNILIKDNKPILNKWSFDKENRRKFDKDYKEDKIKTYKNKYIEEAKEYINKYFPDNYGIIEEFYYPITHKETKRHFRYFLQNKLDTFGKYQDSISKNVIFGSHSVLSPMLNVGLITPYEIVKETLKKYNKFNIITVEAFLRQIIGWRSYMRFIYYFHGKEIKNMNFFNFTKSLPNSWYNGNTNIDIIDNMIEKVKRYAYLHHIERLMIMGNFCLLNEYRPDDVYKWFMIYFIDSYDWVMIPNVYGMSQYSLEGISMMTRPYISSSNYIKKMSDYKSSYNDKWDKLYWKFIKRHKNKLQNIYSMSYQIKLLDKK